MALQLTITDSDTGATYANAYGRIDDVTLALASGRTEPVLNWYWNPTTAAIGKGPVRIDGTIRLSTTLLQTANPTFVAQLQGACASGSIQTPLDALKTALYLLLQQLPQYQGSVQV